MSNCISSSLPQGESPTEWRTTDFRMFRGGSLWRPPVLNDYSQSGETKSEMSEDVHLEEEVKKGQLKAEYVWQTYWHSCLQVDLNRI